MPIDLTNPSALQLIEINDLIKTSQKENEGLILGGNFVQGKLVKMGEDYWVWGNQLGEKGSGGTVVVALPGFYKRDEKGDYTFQKHETAVKVMRPSRDMNELIYKRYPQETQKVDKELEEVENAIATLQEKAETLEKKMDYVDKDADKDADKDDLSTEQNAITKQMEQYEQRQIMLRSFTADKIKQMAEHEYQMLKTYGDPNSKLEEYYGTYYLKMTKAEGMPLDDYLENNPNLSLDARIEIINKVISEVENLHNKKISHLDLKPNNIFYDPKNNKVSLIDFGSAQYSNTDLSKMENSEMATAEPYRSPGYATKMPNAIDYYSLAGVFGDILYGELEKVESKSLMSTYSYVFDEINKAPYLENSSVEDKIKIIELIGSLKLFSKSIDNNALQMFKKHVGLIKSNYIDGIKVENLRLYIADYPEEKEKVEIILNQGKEKIKNLVRQQQNLMQHLILDDPTIKSSLEAQILNLQTKIDAAQKKIEDDLQKIVDAKKLETELHGVRLDIYLKRNPNLSIDEKVKIIELISRETEALHDKGLSHLNLLPKNIFYDAQQQKVTLLNSTSQSINTDLSQLKEGLLEASFQYLSPLYQSMSPIEVDDYALAGIFGDILYGKAGEIENDLKAVMEELKKFKPNSGKPNLTYDFDKIFTAPFLQKENTLDQMKLTTLISAVKELIITDTKRPLIVFLKNVNEFKATDFSKVTISDTGKAYKVDVFEAPKKEQTLDQLMKKPLWQHTYAEINQFLELIGKLSTIKSKDKIQFGKLKKLFVSYDEYRTEKRNASGFLNDVLKEAIDKQEYRAGGSKVLRGILDLPPALLKNLDPELLKEARKYSVDALTRGSKKLSEAIDQSNARLSKAIGEGTARLSVIGDKIGSLFGSPKNRRSPPPKPPTVSLKDLDVSDFEVIEKDNNKQGPAKK